MALYNLPNSTAGIDNIFVQTIAEVPALTPLILAFVFFLVWIGGIVRQKMRTGTSDYAMWAVVASLMTLMVALIMSVSTGIINLDWLVIVLVITLMCGVWLFLDRRASEI